MKKTVLCLSVLCLCLSVTVAGAREIDKAGVRMMRTLHDDENQAFIDQGARDMKMASAVDSFCLVWYDFETMDWQGWTFLDNTAQIDTFWHVDDFAGLGGGDYGGLVALEGSKSMWCGSRGAEDSRAEAEFWYLCNWNDAPGYGNSWVQFLATDAFPITGIMTISYKGYFDSEPDFDETFVEYDRGDDNWTELARYDGTVDTIASHSILPNQVATKLRFRFEADGAWSDQDGLWDTDGAAIVDSITVSDVAGLIDYEDWEDEGLDTHKADGNFWYASVADAYGSYAGLTTGLMDKDPCGDNFSTQIVFFQGSVYPSADYPGLFDTPFCKGEGGTTAPCQDESILSPQIEYDMYSSGRDENQDTPIPPAILPDLGGTVFRFTVMRDLPLPNLVFYTWAIRGMVDGCPSQWQDRSFVYYGPEKDYIQSSFDVSDLVGAYPLQVVIGVSDMCSVWFNINGDCAGHTPAPWVDNIRLYKYSTAGPQWSHRDLDLFQDNFPGVEFNIESYVRADCANDLRPNDDPVIDPGDSAVVGCSADYSGGLDTLATGEARVYCHVWAQYIGTDGLKSDLYGPSLEGSYGTYVSDDGARWTTFHCPQAMTSSGNAAPDRYMIDLNDSLFTRGYQVNYYFKAYSMDGGSSCLPEDAELGTGDVFEFTCLPTLNSDILFVDDFHGRGTFDGTVQTYWDPTFLAVSSFTMPDRYDVNSPSSLVSNGPGSRAKNYHLVNTYEAMIWDSGNLSSGTITEGSTYSDKSNDAQMLIDWMELSEHKVGLWVMGDGVAEDLDGSPASSALALLTTYCGVQLVNASYFELTGGRTAGGVVIPQVTGVTGGIYQGIEYYAFGGCPIINGFDVLEKDGGAEYSLRLPDYNSVAYYIGISNELVNSAAYPVRTSWIGHSMMYVRNGSLQVARNELADATWEYFEQSIQPYTGETVPAQYSLMQNYPNPFNPSTTIRFNLPGKGHVSLKIYNVAGQLVRILTDQDWDAGRHSIDWNGRNEAGASVASGVYFYRIEADSFESTKKMVLLR